MPLATRTCHRPGPAITPTSMYPECAIEEYARIRFTEVCRIASTLPTVIVSAAMTHSVGWTARAAVATPSAAGCPAQPVDDSSMIAEEPGGLGDEGQERRDRRGGALVHVGRVEVHRHGGDLEAHADQRQDAARPSRCVDAAGAAGLEHARGSACRLVVPVAAVEQREAVEERSRRRGRPRKKYLTPASCDRLRRRCEIVTMMYVGRLVSSSARKSQIRSSALAHSIDAGEGEQEEGVELGAVGAERRRSARGRWRSGAPRRGPRRPSTSRRSSSPTRGDERPCAYGASDAEASAVALGVVVRREDARATAGPDRDQERHSFRVARFGREPHHHHDARRDEERRSPATMKPSLSIMRVGLPSVAGVGVAGFVAGSGGRPSTGLARPAHFCRGLRERRPSARDGYLRALRARPREEAEPRHRTASGIRIADLARRQVGRQRARAPRHRRDRGAWPCPCGSSSWPHTTLPTMTAGRSRR